MGGVDHLPHPTRIGVSVASPLPRTPSRRRGRSNSVVTKEMIGRAFNKAGAPRYIGDRKDDRSRTLEVASVGDVSSSTPRRSPRRMQSARTLLGSPQRLRRIPSSPFLFTLNSNEEKKEKTSETLQKAVPLRKTDSTEKEADDDKRSLLTRSHSQMVVNATKHSLGGDSLKAIADMKSSFADMRPRNRRVKWSTGKTDWDRSTRSSRSIHIEDINLEELQLQGAVGAAAWNGSDATTISNVGQKNRADVGGEGMETLTLQRNLRRAKEELKKVWLNTDREREVALALQEECQALRRELVAMPTLPEPKVSMRQSQKQMATMVNVLEQQIAELDEQIALLHDWQKEEEVDGDGDADSVFTNSFLLLQRPQVEEKPSSTDVGKSPCQGDSTEAEAPLSPLSQFLTQLSNSVTNPCKDSPNKTTTSQGSVTEPTLAESSTERTESFYPIKGCHHDESGISIESTNEKNTPEKTKSAPESNPSESRAGWQRCSPPPGHIPNFKSSIPARPKLRRMSPLPAAA